MGTLTANSGKLFTAYLLSAMGSKAVKQQKANARAAKAAKKAATLAEDGSTPDSSSPDEPVASSNPPAIETKTVASRWTPRSTTQQNPEASHPQSSDST